MPDNTLQIYPMDSCTGDASVDDTASGYLYFELEVHGGRFEAEGTVDVPLMQDVVIDTDEDHEKSLTIQWQNGFPRPNIWLNNTCIRKWVGVSSAQSGDAIVPFSQTIIGSATVTGVRVGDLNSDGLNDVIYDAQEVDGLLKSFVFYQQPSPLYETVSNRQTWVFIAAPSISGYMEHSGNWLPRTFMQRLYDLAVYRSGLYEKKYYNAARSISDEFWCLLAHNVRQQDFDLESFDRYMRIIEKYFESPEIIERVHYGLNRSWNIDPVSFYESIMRIGDSIESTENPGPLIELFQAIIPEGCDETTLQNLTNLVIQVGQRLPAEQIIVLNYTARYASGSGWQESQESLILKISEIVAENDDDRMFEKFYSFFNGPAAISAHALTSYASLLNKSYHDQDVIPSIADIVAAETSIGAANALLLNEKFHISHFYRYHSSILGHLVEMAKDVNYSREKPLMFVIVASGDSADVFRYGNHYDYDDRVRMVVIEVSDYEEMKELAWQIRNAYGIPDILFITAHGSKNDVPADIILGDYLHDAYLWNNDRDTEVVFVQSLAEDFAGFFGDKEGQIVANICHAGEIVPEGRENPAQVLARAFNAPTLAARDTELLYDLRLEVEDGRAHLVPIFFEVGWPFFGFNYGGMTFYPNREPDYQYVVDTNTGWQPSVSLGFEDLDFHVSGGFGYSHQLWNRLRLRYDVGADFNASDLTTRLFLNAEAGIGITNQLMFAVGARGGLDLASQELGDLFLQEYAAFRFVFSPINSELDIGAIDFDWTDPQFFLRLQTRF